MSWLGTIPAMRDERHFETRVVRCFGERPAGYDAMLREAVARNPHGEALVGGEQRLTYATLDGVVDCTAAQLLALGVAPGDRVAILLENGIPFVVALAAIVRLGAIAVLLNIREEAPELAYILGHSGATVVIHSASLAVKLPATSAIPDVRHRLCIDAGWLAVQLGQKISTGGHRHVAHEEDVAAILYTSGTTGRPKGAMLTNMGLVHAAMIYQACMGLDASDRSIVTVPMSHVTGLTAAIAAMLRAAGTLIIAPAFKADAFIQLAASERMTHTVMVPAMYNLSLLSPSFAAADLSSWRIGGYGGAPMPEITIARLAAQLPGLKLMNAYGSTETTGPVVLMPPEFGMARRSAIGRAVPPCDLRIMDEAGVEVAAGETGEVWLRAPNVVKGYWNNAAATAENFVAGYWRSGDLGSVDADGFLTLLDRKKDIINRGGFKIYSVEVENVLAAHPEVIEAAVVAKACPVLGERVHAFVVAKTGAFDATQLRNHCAGQLADYKIPETFTVLDGALPRNANGKVLKRELREQAAKADPA
ncbi:MAG: class I adenylate-forming enzyme family protein [Hyphomicrobiaceae bacterium]